MTVLIAYRSIVLACLHLRSLAKFSGLASQDLQLINQLTGEVFETLLARSAQAGLDQIAPQSIVVQNMFDCRGQPHGIIWLDQQAGIAMFDRRRNAASRRG